MAELLNIKEASERATQYSGKDFKKSENEYEYCLVGNIIDKHRFGENGEIRYGTKHFRPGARVYIFPQYGGMGHENIQVIGFPRKRYRLTSIVIPTKFIINVRVAKIFQPFLKEKIVNNFYYSIWKKTDNELECLTKFAESINKRNQEYYQSINK
jgi:hypothetical protein